MTPRAPLVVAVSYLLMLGALAHAWTLRVDDADGPADLAATVAAAEQRWVEAGVEFAAVERTVLVRYAAEDRMGPDAIALVVTGGTPGVDMEIWLRAEGPTTAQRADALTIALGIALGGTPGSGVLDPRLGDEPRLPSAEDVAGLVPAREVPGDVTGDGRVGFDDLLALAESWGRRGVNLPADLDGDGVVDGNDLERLREHYRFAPLPSERDAPRADEDATSEEPSEAPGDEPLGDASQDDVAPTNDDPLDDDEERNDERTGD